MYIQDQQLAVLVGCVHPEFADAFADIFDHEGMLAGLVFLMGA